MTLAEDAAVLLLAERIALGEAVNVDSIVSITVPFSKTPVSMSLEHIERAARLAEDRRDYGYAGGAEDAARVKAANAKAAAERKATTASKEAEKKGKKGGG